MPVYQNSESKNMRIKPKIVISSYDDLKNPYYAGGGARAIHSIAKRLIKKYRVVIVTSKYPRSKDEIIDNVRYKRIGVSWAGPKLGQLVYHLFLVKTVLTEEFDLWAESFTPPFSTTFLPLFTKKPVVGLVHMLSSEDMIRKYKLPFSIVENFGLSFYKYFIVLSRVTRRKISDSNPKAHFFVIPNGVDLPNQIKVKKSKRVHILFIGRIEINQKGLDLLLKSFKLISSKVKKKLVIAGTGTTKEIHELRELVSSLDLTKDVELVGRVQGREWEKVLKAAWVVVIPSRFETFPLVALEALAYQSPVVCFDIEGLKWLPNTVSLKAKKFNTNQLAESILKLSSNSAARRRLLKDTSEFIAQHSWKNVATKYDNAFRSILSS